MSPVLVWSDKQSKRFCSHAFSNMLEEFMPIFLADRFPLLTELLLASIQVEVTEYGSELYLNYKSKKYSIPFEKLL